MNEQKVLIGDELFLGRIEEQERFREVLHIVLHRQNDKPNPFIFLIFGEGGMGKSQLTRRLYDIAQQEVPFEHSFFTLRVDWELVRHDTLALQIPREQIRPEDVLDSLHRSALDRGWGHHFKLYQEVLKRRQHAEQEVVRILDSEKNQKQYANILELGATGLAKLVRSTWPIIGQTGESLSKELLAVGLQFGAEQSTKLLQQADQFLKSRLKPELYEVYRQPHEQLSRALGEGFERVSRSRPLVLFLDTYEIVASTTDIWMRHVIKNAGNRIIWILSGRHNLAVSRSLDGYVGYSAEFSSKLIIWNLQELAIEHVAEYLRNCAYERPVTVDHATTIHKATLGVPLALHIAADLWAQGIEITAITHGIPSHIPRERLVRLMCERVLLHIDQTELGSIDRKDLYALAMQPRPDVLVQTAILRSAERNFNLNSRLFELARRYSVVRIEGGARLHETMRDFIREYLLRTEESESDTVHDIANRAIDELRNHRNNLEDELFDTEEKVGSEDWRQCILDLTHWLFWRSEREAWRELIPYLVDGLGYDINFASSLLEIAQNFKLKLSKDGRRRLKQLELNETNRENLLTELERLAYKGHWLDIDEQNRISERYAILLLWRGDWLSKESRFDEAIKAYQNAEDYMHSAERNLLREKLSNAFSSLSARMSWPAPAASFSVPSETGLTIAQQAVKLTPNNKDAWLQLGSILQELGQYDEALIAFQKVIELDPEHHNAWYILGGYIFPRLGRYDEARSANDKTIRILKKLLDHDNSASYWNLLGLTYDHQNMHEEAIDAYNRALALDPKMDVSWQNMGVCYNHLERYDEAIAAFKRAIETNPQYAIPWNSLGRLYRDLKQYENSIDAYKQAIDLEPYQPRFYTGLGRAYEDLGNYEQAQAVYGQALEHSKSSSLQAYSYDKLGMSYILQGKFELAVGSLSQAIELQPDDIFYHARLVYALTRLGRQVDANNHVILVSESLDRESLYNRACLAALLDQADAALAYLSDAIKKDPTISKWARTDPDFVGLRDEPHFMAMIASR